MKVLVTGGAGFVGSHLVDEMITGNQFGYTYDVYVVDNLATGSRDNIHPKATFFERSIVDLEMCEHLMGLIQPDLIIHAAASYKDPKDWVGDAETNTVGTANIVKAALKYKPKIIYFQTSLCYGHPKDPKTPITLDHPINPTNSYAITKTAAEQLIALSGLDYVSFRLANCYGPRNLSGPVPTFYQKINTCQKCLIADTRRDYIYIDDLVKIVMRAVESSAPCWSSKQPAEQGGYYHISTGQDFAIAELYEAVSKAVANPSEVEPIHIDRKPDDVATILLDPSRTNKVFEVAPSFPLKEGIAKAVAWYQEHGVSETYTHLKEVK
jgi:UDP-glucose 4-epimerase